ncbi:immunoglobulin domain-containing protein [Flavobacterium sp. 3HN19-14]|uniref:immunoglobulin domain-containing protein n=1 Tax=Flavobacterium sp. 3HN19-14 TaxID=3448133 RepID=UPI003EE2FDF2
MLWRSGDFRSHRNRTQLTYQWFKETNIIPGATNPTYTIGFADFSSVGNYHVEVANFCGMNVSSNISVIVNTPPQINTVNVPSDVCAGDTANLSVSASGTNLTYQWFHNDQAVSNQNNFVIPACTAADSGIYQVIVMNGCSEIFSYVNLNVNTPVTPTGDTSQEYTEGQTLANLQVTGTGIKWYSSAQNAANHENALPSSTLLQDGVTYYATETLGGNLRKPDVISSYGRIVIRR